MQSLQNFPTPISQDGEFLLETCRGFWSIIRPLGQDLINGVVNPNFESGTRNFWHNDTNTNNAVLSVTQRTPALPDNAHSGQYALQVNQVAAGEYGATYQPSNSGDPTGVISVDPGISAYMSCYVKACAGDTIILYGTYDGIIAPMIPDVIQRKTNVIATGNWQRVKTYVTNQRSGAVLVAMRVTVTPATACTSFLMDDALITTRDTEYFDGDSDGATWSGAPNLSSSTVDRFSRLVGEEIYLNDIGFNIISWAGAGMIGITNDTIPYAQGGGSYYNKSWPSQQRAMTFVGQIESCKGFKAVQKIHSRLISLISPYRFFVDPQPFIMRFRLTKCECDTTGALELPVVYKGGLEGAVNNLWSERISLQVDAYEDQFWRNPVTKSVAITPNVPTTFCYNGTAPTPMLIRVIGNTVGGANVDFVSAQNLTLGTGVYFSFAAGSNIQPVGIGTILQVGDKDKACAKAEIINNATNTHFNVAGNIRRPLSVPSQFVLLPGDNTILISITNNASLPATVLVQYTERYLSSSDAWRLPVTTDQGCGSTLDLLHFQDRC